MISPVIPTSVFSVLWSHDQTHSWFPHFKSVHLCSSNCFSPLLLTQMCPRAGDISFTTLQQQLKLPAAHLPGNIPAPSFLPSLLQDFSKKEAAASASLHKNGHLQVFSSFACCLERLLCYGAEDGPHRTQVCSFLRGGSSVLQDGAEESQVEALS